MFEIWTLESIKLVPKSTDDIQDHTRNQVDGILKLDKDKDKDLINQIIKTRILNFLLSWELKERIEKQIVFFANICSNILRWSWEKWKEDISCKYVINRYKPGKYDSLNYLYMRKKNLWEESLSFYIDYFLKDLEIFDNVIETNKYTFSKKEIIKAQIQRLNWEQQMKLLEELYKNLQKNNEHSNWLLKSICKLIWLLDSNDKKQNKRSYQQLLMYKSQWKEQYIKLHTHVINSLSDILINRPELSSWIFDKKNLKISNKIKKHNKKDGFIIEDNLKYETQKNKIVRSLIDFENREDNIRVQKDFFSKIYDKIQKKEKDIYTTISKFLWEKEHPESFSLRRLLNWNNPINEKNLYLIINKLIEIDESFVDLLWIKEIETSVNDVLFYWISKKSTEEQRQFLKHLYDKLSTKKEYVGITNRLQWKLASTIKNFINPLKYKLSEIYLRQKIKDVMYTKQKKIPKDILNLLIIRLLEEDELFSINYLLSISFNLEKEKLKEYRLKIFKELYDKKIKNKKILDEISEIMDFSIDDIKEELEIIRENKKLYRY